MKNYIKTLLKWLKGKKGSLLYGNSSVSMSDDNQNIHYDNIDLVAENHCEILICKKCGQEYYSSGKFDPGICKSCIALENFIGGPLGK